MSNDKTLIIGGFGFIGVNLIQHLKGKKNLRVLDNLKRSSPTGVSIDDVEFVQGDILNPSGIEQSFSGVKEVVHLAAYGSVMESIANPLDNFLVNAQGTLNVLRASVAAGVKKFIFASTGGALVGDAEVPVNEISLPKPISPYGASKLCGEAYCHAFSKTFGLEAISLRFGNVYGQHSAHKKGAVTLFIKALMNDEPIVIYGDGHSSRDYVYVSDLCSGISSALNTPLLGGEVFHIGSGRETSVLSLAKTLCKVAGKPNHPIQFKKYRQGEVTRNFADYNRAKLQLKFKPVWELEDGLAETWRWSTKQDKSLFFSNATDA
jgi:UDP-glucose 4-epimerase